jgi:hypothetical protein
MGSIVKRPRNWKFSHFSAPQGPKEKGNLWCFARPLSASSKALGVGIIY